MKKFVSLLLALVLVLALVVPASATPSGSGGSHSGIKYYSTSAALVRTGNRGEDVKTLQERLNALGYNCGDVDGIFGAKTLAAVKAFQTAKSLSVDGIVGVQTWGALR